MSEHEYDPTCGKCKPVPDSVPRADVLAALRSLGIDPNRVMSLTLTPDKITVTAAEIGADGRKVPNALGTGFLRYQVDIEIT